jgi:hypothetical protein
VTSVQPGLPIAGCLYPARPRRAQPQPGSDPLSQQLESIAEDIVKRFEVEMGEVVENLERGEKAFDDLSGGARGHTRPGARAAPQPACPALALPVLAAALLDSAEGFDLSRGTWRKSGWRELDSLREASGETAAASCTPTPVSDPPWPVRPPAHTTVPAPGARSALQVLEKVPELRELVRQLGRGGGRGPLRRAPEEVEARGYPAGVIRSPLQPEEARRGPRGRQAVRRARLCGRSHSPTLGP